MRRRGSTRGVSLRSWRTGCEPTGTSWMGSLDILRGPGLPRCFRRLAWDGFSGVRFPGCLQCVHGLALTLVFWLCVTALAGRRQLQSLVWPRTQRSESTRGAAITRNALRPLLRTAGLHPRRNLEGSTYELDEVVNMDAAEFRDARERLRVLQSDADEWKVRKDDKKKDDLVGDARCSSTACRWTQP